MRKSPLVKILLFFCIAIQIRAQSDEFSAQLLDERNGIRTSSISRIARDKDGFLWLLSPRYLERYDGQSVRHMEVEGEDMLDIAVDHMGDIWVTTQSGIKVFENDFLGFREVPVEGSPNTKFNLLQVSPDNTVWVVSGLGLYRLDRENRCFRHHPLPGLPEQLYYRRLFARYNDELFLGDTHTIFAYNTGNGRVRQIPLEGGSNLVALSEDVLWVTDTRKRVFELDFGKMTKRLITADSFQPRMGSPFLEIIGYLPLNGPWALISTNHGCYRYHKQRGVFEKAEIYNYGKPLRIEEVTVSYFDDRGILWLVYQDGVLFFKPLQHQFQWRKDYSDTDRGGNNKVYAIEGAAGGKLWLGTVAGLSLYDPVSGKSEMIYPPKDMKDPDVTHSVRALAYDGRILVLGAYSGGVLIYDTERKTFRKPIYPSGDEGRRLMENMELEHIYRIVRLHSGDYLVLGDLHCYLLTKSDYRLRRLEFEGSNYILQAAAETSHGNLWLAGYRGLIYLNRDFQTLYQDTLVSPNRLVSALLLLNDSLVWAGGLGVSEVKLTYNGMIRREILPELANQQVQMLFRDRSGKVWIGTENGLFRYTPAAGRLEWFDLWDNLQNKQLNRGAFYWSADHGVYLGGNSGLNYFYPDSIPAEEEELKVKISGVRIIRNDSLIHEGSSHLFATNNNGNRTVLDLPWDNNSLEIQFATPYFRNPGKLRYRYRMEGLDSVWVMTGATNSVRFSWLKPGLYRFMVGTSLDGVQWYEASSPFHFRIHPPLWRKWWFILLCILMVISVSYVLIRQRIRSIRMHESKVYSLQNRASSLEKEKALAMYEGLKQQLNPHFLFNSLTSLSSLIRVDQQLAGEFLQGLSKTYRYILKNRDDELVPLNSEVKFAKTFVKLQKTRFEEGLEVSFLVEESKAGRVLIAPVTLQNLIENAMKHNVISPDSPLVIEIFLEDEYMTVRNNKQKKKFVETSNRQGLANLKSLYWYLTEKPVLVTEDSDYFTVKIPIIYA